MSKSIYDRQLNIDLFKRLHLTTYGLTTKRHHHKIIGPGSYNPITINEIYRQKHCSKYGPYYQQSKRFPSTNRNSQISKYVLNNIPDELRRKNEFQRHYNAVRLDRQSSDKCRQRKEVRPRAPPVTLYEKLSFVDKLQRIHGPYVKLTQNNHNHRTVDWYKGPARLQDKIPSSIFELLFSKYNYYKGKFLPLPSHAHMNQCQLNPSPGPTTYFKNLLTQKHRIRGFVLTREQFNKPNISILRPGPASYKPETCLRLCSLSKK